VDAIMDSVRNGVNVLFWFAIDIVESAELAAIISRGPPVETMVTITDKLREEGLEVAHLISIGGWNEVHPFTDAGAAAAFQAFKHWNEHDMARPELGFYGFDGFDWDIEGNDDKASPFNEFTAESLNLMGEMSVLAKREGYLVTMAPPESYLDPRSSDFSRSLRGTLPEWRELVPEFTYHGLNGYAFLLAKFGKTLLGPIDADDMTVDTFDLVILQLYESYGHLNHHIEVQNGDPSEWLVDLVHRMSKGWTVQFSSDDTLGCPDSVVQVPPEKLVIGLANAWANDSEKDSAVTGVRKTLFVRPSVFEPALRALPTLRGFAFWTLVHEGDEIGHGDGREPLYMAKELRAIRERTQ